MEIRENKLLCVPVDFAINISQVFGIQIVCFCSSTISIRIATAKNKSSSNIYKSADWHIRHTIYVTHDINMCVHCAKRHLFTRFPFVWRAMTERKTFNFTIVYTWNELQANFVCFIERKQNKYQPLVGFEIICISFLFQHYKNREIENNNNIFREEKFNAKLKTFMQDQLQPILLLRCRRIFRVSS